MSRSCHCRASASIWRENLVVNGGGTDALLAPVWNQIDEDFDEHLEDIRNFLRCPTVSASDDDMLAGAEYVAALIEGAGGSAEIIPTAGHPAVLGASKVTAPGSCATGCTTCSRPMSRDGPRLILLRLVLMCQERDPAS